MSAASARFSPCIVRIAASTVSRVRPVPPARSEIEDTRASPRWDCSTRAPRRAAGLEPSRRNVWEPGLGEPRLDVVEERRERAERQHRVALVVEPLDQLHEALELGGRRRALREHERGVGRERAEACEYGEHPYRRRADRTFVECAACAGSL
jgi:hypothetical protein